MTFALALIATCIAVSSPAALTGSDHPREFWTGITQQKFALPAGESAPALAAELSSMLGSPDPELRDGFGYSILTNWVYSQKLLTPADLRVLMAQWVQNLKSVGSVGTDAIFRRSFSALMLSVVVARDNVDPFLEQADVRLLLDSAIVYFASERDVRGYDPKTGWMHSAAHTADLLKFLGRSRFVTPADQRAVLDAIATKMAGTGLVFTHGEDERMARAVLSIVRRTDFDQPAFGAWISRTKPVASTSPKIDPAKLYGDQNVKNLFAKLEVLLSLEPDPPAAVRAAAEALRAALKTMY